MLVESSLLRVEALAPNGSTAPNSHRNNPSETPNTHRPGTAFTAAALPAPRRQHRQPDNRRPPTVLQARSSGIPAFVDTLICPRIRGVRVLESGGRGRDTSRGGRQGLARDP